MIHHWESHIAMEARQSASARRWGRALSVCLLAGVTIFGVVSRAQNPPPPAAPSPSRQSSAPAPNLPLGKNLILKDGTFQLVREYRVEGDRVRYYSIDSSQWEEMPADLVDWDKTKKVEAEEAKHGAAAVAKARNREAKLARQADVFDVDASVEAAPGVFLPPGEGLFAFDGKAVLKLAQAPIDSKKSPKRTSSSVCLRQFRSSPRGTIFRSIAHMRNSAFPTASPNSTCAWPADPSRSWS